MVDGSSLDKLISTNNSSIVRRIIKSKTDFFRENNLIPNEIILTPEDYNVLCELYPQIPSSINLNATYASFMGMRLKVECIPNTLLRYTVEMPIYKY